MADETSSNTACWALHLLASNPNEQERCRAQVDAAFAAAAAGPAEGNGEGGKGSEGRPSLGHLEEACPLFHAHDVAGVAEATNSVGGMGVNWDVEASRAYQAVLHDSGRTFAFLELYACINKAFFSVPEALSFEDQKLVL